MYVRAAAVILMVLCGAFCGMNSSEKLRKRGDICLEIGRMLRICEFSIRSCEAEVYSIVSRLKAAELSMLTFLNELPESYEENGDFHDKWRTSVQKCSGFAAEEKTLLIEIGASLGTSDSEGQLRALAVYQTRAQELYELRAAEYRTKGRLYRSLGLLAGVTVGIIAI